MMHYDDISQRWYIDLWDGEEPPPREPRRCDHCQAYEELGCDACLGCAG